MIASGASNIIMWPEAGTVRCSPRDEMAAVVRCMASHADRCGASRPRPAVSTINGTDKLPGFCWRRMSAVLPSIDRISERRASHRSTAFSGGLVRQRASCGSSAGIGPAAAAARQRSERATTPATDPAPGTLGSTSTMPATRSGWRSAKARMFRAPSEWPTRMTGPGACAAVSAAARSSATAAASRGNGPGSLKPWPARSMAQTRCLDRNPAITRRQARESAAQPESSTTAGCPRPSHQKLRVRPSGSFSGWSVGAASSDEAASMATASTGRNPFMPARLPHPPRQRPARRPSATAAAAAGSAAGRQR